MEKFGVVALVALTLTASRVAAQDAQATRGEEIILTGARVQTPALGALGDRPVLDTPFSIATYDANLVRDLQATTLSDLLRIEPSATVNLPAASETTSYLLRGFSTREQFVNSVPVGTPSESLELYDSVQILKGAAGFLYGFTAPGGIINLVTKRPAADAFLLANFGFQESSVLRAHVDAGIGSAGGRVATRFNLVGENGRYLYINSKTRRYALSLNTDLRITPDTIVQLDYSRERRRRFGNSYGFYLNDNSVPVPAPISGSTRLTPDYSYYRGEFDSVAPAIIQQLGNGWTARLDMAFSRFQRNYHDSELDGLMADGSYSLGVYAYNTETRTSAGQLVVTGTTMTGPIVHALAFGGSYTRSIVNTGRNADGTESGAVSAGIGNINDGDVPNFPDPLLENPSLRRKYRSQEATDKALFVSDTLSAGPFSLLLGGRYVWREQRRLSAAGAPTGRYDRAKLTSTTALLWKPAPVTTVYASYAQALQNGGTAGANAANAGETLPPIASKQYEAGVKTQVGRLLATAAVFRIDRGFEFLRQQGGGLLPVLTQDGVQRHDGAEISVSGTLGQAWRFSGGLQLLDPVIRDGTPALTGKRPPGVPKAQGKLFAEYAPAVVPGLAVNGVFTYVSASYLDPTNLQRLNDYATVDLGARYGFSVGGRDLTLRVAIENVFARRYWLRTDALIPGTPRAVSASLQVGF